MSADLSQALTDLALAAISAATLAISAFLIPYLKARYGAQRVETAAQWADKLVKAAEQNFRQDDPAGKYNWVYTALAKHAPYLSVTQLDALIEAAVHSLSSIDVAVNAPAVPTTTQVATVPKAKPASARHRGPDGRFLKGDV